MNFRYKNLLTILLLVLSSCSYCPENPGPVHSAGLYTADDYTGKLDSLKNIFGKNKNLPAGFELQALLALSHYPELKESKIQFLVKQAFIPLSSRPATISLVRKENRRRYKVIISEGRLDQMGPYLLKNLPFNAQVAIIGHELAHTACYRNMNSLQVIATGISYFFPGFRAGFEKSTDQRTIDHGLGWHLLEYAEYVRSLPNPMEGNPDWMDKFYMNPEEIRTHMRGLKIYGDSPGSGQ